MLGRYIPSNHNLDRLELLVFVPPTSPPTHQSDQQSHYRSRHSLRHLCIHTYLARLGFDQLLYVYHLRADIFSLLQLRSRTDQRKSLEQVRGERVHPSRSLHLLGPAPGYFELDEQSEVLMNLIILKIKKHINL